MKKINLDFYFILHTLAYTIYLCMRFKYKRKDFKYFKKKYKKKFFCPTVDKISLNKILVKCKPCTK